MTFNLSRIGRGLPIAGRLSELQPGNMVIQAPPGTGKTTVIPPAMANLLDGLVIVTAPRRVAVRAAAHRLAQLDNSRVGDRVGYSIKGEHHPGSRVEFVTPGVLLRRLQRDPALDGVAAVLVDEVHERQLDTDLALAMLIELSQLRDDFCVVAMSATVDVAAFAELLDAPVVATPAVIHPLEIRYAPHPGRVGCTHEFLYCLADAAHAAVAETGHSALIFVPGVREVTTVVDYLSGRTPALPLHGSLTSTEQDRALRPSASPRIVVSTSIAESSVTVPGVRIVVDSGLSRIPRRDASRGMTGLVTVSAAQSTCQQRAGRAGREGPGLVIRGFSAEDFAHAPAHITPEIQTRDLAEAALQMACWGAGKDFPLPTAAPIAAMEQAWKTLEELGAVVSGQVTALGHKLARLPLDPRLGRALVECGSGAATTIAVLSDSPRGNLSQASPPAKEVRRLAALVEDSPPVPAGVVTALAFPSRIARRVGNTNDYLLVSGTRATLPAGLGLDDSEWLAIAEVTRQKNNQAGKSGALIRAAARLDDPLRLVPITEQVKATIEGGRVRCWKVTRAGAIELSTTPYPVDPAIAAEALGADINFTVIRKIFHFNKAAEELLERIEFLHAQLGDPWPDVRQADPLLWLGPELDAVAHGANATSLDMHAALQRLLPWPEAQHFEKLAPTRLCVPSGSSIKVDYGEAKPIVRVKLQECFGWAESPTCAGVKVLFHLLSPAGRPLAVTDDLASFWSGPYAQVRAEMRGRYPKHPWPEDPWNAVATARAKKRGG